eukprot:8289973-Karenia_brevis.AAC.1
MSLKDEIDALKQAMSLFHYRLAYMGGSATMWGVERGFDKFCEDACNPVADIRAYVHTGC